MALNPQEVYELSAEGSCGERTPVMTLGKEDTMVYGKPLFQSSLFYFHVLTRSNSTFKHGPTSATGPTVTSLVVLEINTENVPVSADAPTTMAAPDPTSNPWHATLASNATWLTNQEVRELTSLSIVTLFV